MDITLDYDEKVKISIHDAPGPISPFRIELPPERAACQEILIGNVRILVFKKRTIEDEGEEKNEAPG